MSIVADKIVFGNSIADYTYSTHFSGSSGSLTWCEDANIGNGNNYLVSITVNDIGNSKRFFKVYAVSSHSSSSTPDGISSLLSIGDTPTVDVTCGQKYIEATGSDLNIDVLVRVERTKASSSVLWS